MASSKAEILQASRERDRKKRQASVVIGLVTIFLLVGFVIFIFNLSFLRVNNINIIGQTSADQGVVKEFINSQLAGHYLGLIPKNSVFFVSKKILMNSLMKKFPGLAKVTIEWPDLNSLSVTVLDRESKILWCLDIPKDKCYYVAPDGHIYQEAPSFSDSLYIELHSKRAGVVKIGDKVIEPQALIRANAFLNFVKSSISLWPETGLKLSRAEVYSQNDFVAILIKPSEPNWQSKIMFNTDQIANNIITNYHSVLKNDKFRKDLEASNNKLEYLDIRFPGKVFYRFK